MSRIAFSRLSDVPCDDAKIAAKNIAIGASWPKLIVEPVDMAIVPSTWTCPPAK